MPANELVFIPERGFMPAHALGTSSNLILERDGKVFTGGVLPDRDGVRVIFTVSGIDADVRRDPATCAPPLRAQARVVDDRERDVPSRPRWITGGYLRDAGGGKATLNWTLILESPQPDARHLDLSFDGPAGDWAVELPVALIDHVGIPARAINVIDHREGITLAARAVARSADLTAIELEAYLDPPSMAEGWARRYVMGIGASMHSGRLCGDQVVMRDDGGHIHLEKGRACPEPTGGKQREAVFFPALGNECRSGVVEVELVWVHEGQDQTLSVPVPGDADLVVAGCEGHVTVTRVAGRDREHPGMPGPPAATSVHVEVAPKDPAADRQLVFAGPTERTVGMTISHCFGKLPTVEIPERNGELAAVTFRGGTVQVRGPWRLEIPLGIS